MDTLLEIAITAVTTAGKEIMRLNTRTDFTTKTDGSPVTAADIRSHEIILEHLAKTNIPILSEEGPSVQRPYPAKLWVVDPLDGTKDFLAGTDDFSIMLGLLIEAKPAIGVVYVPALDTLYYAVENTGAFMQTHDSTVRLHINKEDLQKQLRFLCSVHHFTPLMEAVSLKLNAHTTPRGSIGIKAGLIAENVGDFSFTLGNLGEWDVCAPEVILREAGGMVTDTNGNLLSYENDSCRLKNGVVLSNGFCHERVISAIREGNK